MSDELTIDSQIFISSKRASQLSGYEQDYIGQLCRGGNIKARRVGGLWYVSADSLTNYKERADEYKPEPPIAPGEMSKPDSLLSFDGRGYISTSRAAKMTGYSPDYVGQMARAGTIPSRQIGNRWYVEQWGLLKHKETKDALLGAVQVESVGLKTPVTTSKVKASSDILIYPPLFQYTSDNRELLPSITSASSDAVPDKEEVHEEKYVIPIRVYHGVEEKVRRAPRSMPVVTEPRMAMLPMLLPVGLFTIVIVLSLGFVSLKKSSIYTNDVTKEGITVVQLASTGVALIGKMGDTLERWVVPEIVYQRTK